LGLRDISTGDALAAQIKQLGRNALPVQMDVTKMGEIRAAVDLALQTFAHIDILMNNVGFGKTYPVEQVPEEYFDEIIAANLKGTFFTAQAVGKVMINQGHGTIINIGSQAGFVAIAGESVYCMTKAAIAHLTKCMAAEWAQYHITVNAVAPTFIETPGTQPDLEIPEFRQSVINRIPLGRVGNVSEVAWPVVFLASPAASLITGATLLIDGGWTLQ
jgi:NAD(P)-dependent dehydrogenase (short-subunit alcohol dehydrogenase family)